MINYDGMKNLGNHIGQRVQKHEKQEKDYITAQSEFNGPNIGNSSSLTRQI
jgi:hypothetical protein